MLQTLRIRNLALLEEVSLDFEAGFTAVTGETGAGKSILLGALGLLAGGRADKTVIRQGAAACEVEASLHFADPRRIDSLLEELALPACEEGVLILKRSIAREKAPKIAVNGGMATLAALQSLGDRWIDFHGPSEPRRLLRESCQLELLDLFGRTEPELAAYRDGYAAWRSLQAERRALAEAAELGADQVEFLQRQLAGIDSIELTAEAIAALERDFQRLSRAQELIGLAGRLAAGLTGEDGVQGRLAALLREARTLERLDPAGAALAARMEAAAVELNDLGAEFAALGRELDFDPEQAERVTRSMETWLELKRKYGADAGAVLAARDRMRARLEGQSDRAGALARIDRDIAQLDRSVRSQAAALRSRREKAAKDLAKTSARAIAELGFQRADFRIRLDPLPEPGPAGDCAAEFLFSPNVGEPLLPLSRVASSGELARVMLALKAVLADHDEVPLLVFDEVDANVGGEIGRIVGEKMAAIGRSHQVLCVTHLPQVAARAASHLVVAKDQSGDRAVVSIAPIHAKRQARVDELARMLGDRSARSARAHAEELLKGPG